MGPKVSEMVASKELKVSVHLPKVEGLPSAAKPLVVVKKNTTKLRKNVPVASGALFKKLTPKRKLDENTSSNANVVVSNKKPHLIDLADSDSSDELSVTERAVLPRAAAKQNDADALWDDSGSEQEM